MERVHSCLLRIGGKRWRLDLPTVDLLNAEKLAAYLEGDSDFAAAGAIPRMRVTVDGRLSGETNRPPVAYVESHGIVFEGHEARWTSDLKLDEVEATVGQSPLAVERALASWICARVVADAGLMLHAAAVRTARGALLLFAPSGGGKSTASALAGERSLCTNAVVVVREAGTWQVYTTPFTGLSDPYPKEPGPFQLDGGLLLEKAQQAQGRQPLVGSTTALGVIAAAVVAQYPRDAAWSARMLQTVGDLAANCDVGRLPFRVDSINLPDR